MVNSVSVEDGDGSDLFPIQTTTLLRQAFGCGRLHCSLSPVQTDATLLDVTCCVRLHTLLHVVAQSLKLVKRLATCKRTQ